MLLNKSGVRKSKKTAVISAVVGGVIGAGVTALLAPKTGKKLRKDISDSAKELGSSVEGLISKVKKVKPKTVARKIRKAK